MQRVRCVVFSIARSGDCRCIGQYSQLPFTIAESEDVNVRPFQENENFAPLEVLVWRFLSTHPQAYTPATTSFQFNWRAPVPNYLLQVRWSDQAVAVTQLECSVALHTVHSESLVPAVRLYSQEDREIGQEAQFTLATPAGNMRLTLVSALADVSGRVGLTIRYPDEIPDAYRDHFMVIGPEGPNNDPIAFPLNELVVTVLEMQD